MKESLKASLVERGWLLEADPMFENGAFILKYPTGESIATIRIVFGDSSGADLVLTHMTVLPWKMTGRGIGSRALSELISLAEERGCRSVLAVQVQCSSEGFWRKNGFARNREPNPCNDFAYIGRGGKS